MNYESQSRPASNHRSEGRLGLVAMSSLFVLLWLVRPGWGQQMVTWVWVQDETSRLRMEDVLDNLNEPAPEFGNAKSTEEYIKLWNLPIHIDDSSAEAHGKTAEDFQERPTLGQTKFEFLSLLEDKFEASLCIRHQHVQLTWDCNATLGIYDVTCLAKNRRNSAYSSSRADFHSIIRLLQASIDANWDVDGGTDGAYPWSQGDRCFLVVRAPVNIHLRIQELFRAMGLVECGAGRPNKERTPKSSKIRRSNLSK